MIAVHSVHRSLECGCRQENQASRTFELPHLPTGAALGRLSDRCRGRGSAIRNITYTDSFICIRYVPMTVRITFRSETYTGMIICTRFVSLCD